MSSRPPKPKLISNEQPRIDMLRKLPPVEECLSMAERDPVLARFAQVYLKDAIRDALAKLRSEIVNSGADYENRNALSQEVLRRVRIAIETDKLKLSPVVNATGTVLHTNL